MATLIGAFSSWSAWWSYVSLTAQRKGDQSATWRDQYNVLRAYYLNNGLYDVVKNMLVGFGYKAEALKPLRNPTHRVVEFYAAKLWPGTLASMSIVTDNTALDGAIRQMWEWSNLGSEKQAIARTFPMYGDLFLKAAGKPGRVYLQNLAPQNVSDFSADERGYLDYIRIDVPRLRRKNDGEVEAYTLTEVWDKATQLFRRWEHDKGLTATIDQLPTPTERRAFGEFGIDFIPVVWQPFKNIADERGMAAITPAIDKIDEANRQATRLHAMIFRYNKPLWAASAGGVDASGRPLPPPRLGGSSGDKLTMSDDAESDDILRLPGTSKLDPLVPNLDFEGALKIIDSQMAEIRQDLPEMIYSQLYEHADLSGAAIRNLMAAANDRLLEARGNAETALIRANQMAITIGQNLGLFDGLGSYENGDFVHSFAERPVWTTTELEKAEIMRAYTGASVPVELAAKRAGWQEAEVDELTQALATEQQQATDNASNVGNILAQLRGGNAQ